MAIQEVPQRFKQGTNGKQPQKRACKAPTTNCTALRNPLTKERKEDTIRLSPLPDRPFLMNHHSSFPHAIPGRRRLEAISNILPLVSIIGVFTLTNATALSTKLFIALMLRCSTPARLATCAWAGWHW